jgi:hypothetical protein
MLQIEEIRAPLAAPDPPLSDVQSYLFGLLIIVESPDSLAQMDRKAQTYAGRDQTYHLAREPRSPLVAMFEDLHWTGKRGGDALDSFGPAACCPSPAWIVLAFVVSSAVDGIAVKAPHRPWHGVNQVGRHPIRFGVQTVPQQISWAELRETWQEVETLGR